jgi:hypothetical protein
MERFLNSPRRTFWCRSGRWHLGAGFRRVEARRSGRMNFAPKQTALARGRLSVPKGAPSGTLAGCGGSMPMMNPRRRTRRMRKMNQVSVVGGGGAAVGGSGTTTSPGTAAGASAQFPSSGFRWSGWPGSWWGSGWGGGWGSGWGWPGYGAGYGWPQPYYAPAPLVAAPVVTARVAAPVIAAPAYYGPWWGRRVVW